jgi:hypothetical protein
MMVLLLPLVALIVVLSSNEVAAFTDATATATGIRAIRRLCSVHMFTGIVEEMGVVQSLVERDDVTLWDGSKGRSTELTVKGNVVLDGAYLG